MRLTAVSTLAAAMPAPPGPAQRRRRLRLAVRLVLLPLGLAALLASAFLAGALLHRSGTLSEYGHAFRAHLSPAYWLGLPFRKRLETVRVDMKFKSYQTIAAKRETALRNRILDASDDDLVKADWHFRGKSYPVKMRLKGDWIDHLQGDKWSYRVQVESDETFLGMKRFSIQHPAARNYLYEWAYLEHLRSLALLAPRYEFVDVVFNGRKLGIYAVEEHFAKELVEAQRRREGPIVRFDEDTLWKQRIRNSRRHGPWTQAFLDDPDGSLFDPNAFTATVAAFGLMKAAEKPDLLAQFHTAMGLLRGYQEGRLLASAVFDPEATGRFLAVVDLWSAEHNLDWHNLRFYYSPLTGLLEPIGFGAEVPDTPAEHLLGPAFALRVLDDPKLGRAYVRELRRLTDPAALEGLRAAMGPRYRELAKSLFWEFGALPEPWALLAERARLVRLELAPVKQIVAYLGPGPQGGAASGPAIQVRNVSALPVELGGVEADGHGTVGAALLLRPETTGGARTEEGVLYLRPTQSSPETAAAEYAALALPAEWLPPIAGPGAPAPGAPGVNAPLATAVLAPGKAPKTPVGVAAPAQQPPPAATPETAPLPVIRVQYRLAGADAWLMEEVVPYPPALADAVLAAPTVAAVESAHPFVRCDSMAHTCRIAAGDWSVAGSLLLPAGHALVVEAGTTLRFERDARLQATGSLTLTGTAAHPIALRAKDDWWQGVYVVRAGAPSRWSFVEIAKTSGVRIPGLGITGGVTFFESPLVASDCRFLGTRAEDALNVIRGSLHLRRAEFADTSSDAIDGDFADGHIGDSVFHDIHGDCLDLSGSTLEVARVTAIRIGDKVVSAGEASRVVVRGIDAEDVGIGIASKDRSSVEGEEIAIRGARATALAAYTKKAEYGPATLRVTGLVTSGCKEVALVDLGSRIEIDGRLVEGQEKLDVKRLYATGELGN